MSRNGSGTYTRVNTFVSGAVITALAHNQNWADLETEMTNSLPRDGQAAMTGQFKATNGSAAAPSISFDSDADSGIYRSAADTVAIVAGGAGIFFVGTTTVSSVNQILAPLFVGTGAAPIGGGMDWFGTTAPTGWLFAYGQNISRTTYASLFTVYGTIYGAGDGSTTFTLPDLRGSVTAGLDNMGGSDAGRLVNALTISGNRLTLGGKLGEASHALTQGELPQFTPSGTISTGNITHTAAQGSVGAGGILFPTNGGGGFAYNQPVDAQTFSGVTIGANGSHNVTQPTHMVNKIIYTGVL